MRPRENERDRLDAWYMGERETDRRRRFREIERRRRMLLLRREIERLRLDGERCRDTDRLRDEKPKKCLRIMVH